MTTAAKISYAIMGAILLALIIFNLGHVLLAALFAFMFMETAYRLLRPRLPETAARWTAATTVIIAIVVVLAVFLHFVKQTLLTLPAIVENALPQIMLLAQKYGLDLPFANFADLRELINGKLVVHAFTITKASTFLTREVFHMVIAIVAAVFFFLGGKTPEYKVNLFDAIRKETNARIKRFMRSFEKVLGAQIIISAINTALTALFLYAVAMPHIPFLTTMTFIIGILPIVGNIITNTVIVITALGISLNEALLALAFLIFIHKMEYFLNSRIMGSNINTPMWQMLMAILIGNIVMGISGIVLAPAILHYIKSELQAIPWTLSPPKPAQ